MSELIQVITAKPDWATKINDTSIVNKWKKELQNQGVAPPILEKVIELLRKSVNDKEEFEDESSYTWHLEVGVDSNVLWSGCHGCECMICSEDEHIKQELEDYDEGDEEYQEIKRKLKKYAKIKCKCVNRWVDDNLDFLRSNIHHKMNMVKKDIKKRFVEHVRAFEDRKTAHDYHPGSNEQMLDIIHPALYCYVKGVTEVVGERVQDLVAKSSLFQWIPAEFSVIRDPTSQEAVRTEIRSYINNLGDRDDPVNGALYQDIAEIFTEMVPGFEQVLNRLKEEKRIHALQGAAGGEEGQEIRLGDCQVIVKIASAEVNEEKKNFDEGSWHLEGVDSEKIIATGIYYYEMKNVEPSFLRFRTTLSGENIYELRYPQNCHEFVHLHYGLKLQNQDYSDGASTIVKLGRIPTKENLSLFFPNFLQHRVSKVSLKEGCHTGRRSILVFFLINPFEKVISTANIPVPQQMTMSLEEAKLYRELLMFERKFEFGEQNKFHQRGISLCEH